jgi:hypothetical protein
VPEEFKAALAITPICVGLVEAAKQSGLPPRWAILAALLFGIVAAWGCAWAEWFTLSFDDPGVTTMTGVVAGLMAMGLLEGGRSLVTGKGAVP